MRNLQHQLEIDKPIETAGVISLLNEVRYQGDVELEKMLLDERQSSSAVKTLFGPITIFYIQNNRRPNRTFGCSGGCWYCYARSQSLQQRLKETDCIELLYMAMSQSQNEFRLNFIPEELFSILLRKDILAALLSYYSTYFVSEPPSLLSGIIQTFKTNPENAVDSLKRILRERMFYGFRNQIETSSLARAKKSSL